MAKIDLTMHKDRLERTLQRARERNIIIPTFAQLKNPGSIPTKIQKELSSIGLWDVHPRNLFRITWKNEQKASGGAFKGVNYIELPSSLTGTDARVIALIGKWFPTGAHKVGAAFGLPRVIIAAVGRMTPHCWLVNRSPFCRRG
jgi:cysteine synthase